jgi:hypothetical protein
MPDFNPYDLADDETNPYAPPKASLEGAPRAATPDLERAEAMRRHYLNHEASVKSIGSLYLLGAVLGGFFTVFALIVMFGGGPGLAPGAADQTGLMAFVAVLYGGITALSTVLGIGLIRLRTWARWIVAVLTGLNLVASLFYVAVLALARPHPVFFVIAGITLLIPAYILYLLVSPKGTVVFSPEYRRIIEQTPHIKYKTSCLVKGLLILILAPIIIGIVVGIFQALFGNK